MTYDKSIESIELLLTIKESISDTLLITTISDITIVKTSSGK